MKTLTVSPELNNPKDARRFAYIGRRQDHGTKDTGRSNSVYGKSAAQMKERDIDRAAADDALDRLSPTLLEKVATSILSAAGFEEPNDYEENWEQLAPGASEAFDDCEDLVDSSVAYPGSLEYEVTSALRNGLKSRANADKIYEGNPSEDTGDYLDGFSIKDRP